MPVFHKSALTLFASLAIAGFTAPASAQSAGDWYGWGSPRRAAPEYDDRTYGQQPRYGDGSHDYDSRDSGDDRYDPADDDRASNDSNNDPRDDQRSYGSPRDDRANSQRSYGGPFDPQPSPYASAPRDDRGYYGDRDVGYGAWDATPSAGDEERMSKKPGREAGGKPFIQAAAPPVVAFRGPYTPGSVVIDTGGRKLYYVINGSSAYAYPIAVGRQGFTWTGKEKVSRIVDWPDWYPPADMRQRKPELPERMMGGINNPLGVKAIYLGNTLYRIHGTNEPKSIGKAESSGCFRMLNENVLHLASLVKVGTEVNVVRSLNGAVASVAKPPSVVKQSPTRVTDRPPPRRWADDDRYYYPPRGYDWRY